MNKQSINDFFKLKKDAVDYSEALGEYKIATEQQKLSFLERMQEQDNKHGFNTLMMEPIKEHDAKKKLNNLSRTRSEQDRILKPERIFDEGAPINLKVFNEAFDRTHKREDDSLVIHNGVPSAWNDFGSTINYSDFDDLNNLYVDRDNRYDTGRENYSGVEFGTKTKISKDEVKKLKGADYVDSHNVLGEDYYKEMKERLRHRDMDASNFGSMVYQDFKKDDTAGYGIFDQLGFKYDDRLQLDDENDLSTKF